MPPTVYNVRTEFQGAFVTARPRTLHLVVHHAAANYAPRYGIDDVRAIRNYHVNTNGWAGIGYQEVLAEETQGGAIACYVVSDPDTQRAHIWGRNHECFGICCAADFTNGIPSQKWQDALAHRLAYHTLRYPGAIIVGHKEITLPGHGTTCPGTRWHIWKPSLLVHVARLTAPAPEPTDPWPIRWGAIASPDQTSWAWDIPATWKLHWQRLGKCISSALYDNAHGVVVQCFEGGDVRQRAGQPTEVTFK